MIDIAMVWCLILVTSSIVVGVFYFLNWVWIEDDVPVMPKLAIIGFVCGMTAVLVLIMIELVRRTL